MSDPQSQRTAIPWATRSLSVFVAAYNELENLAPTVETILRSLRVSIEDYEIIIVDDGSTDGTYEVADDLAARYPTVRVVHNERNMGLGYGFMRAIQVATKESWVFVPGDNTWPYRSLHELFGNLGKADVVTTYTTNPEIRSLPRRLLSTTYTTGLNAAFGLNMRYYNGLTIYPTAWLRANAPSSYGFASMAETLLKAVHQGLSFIEVACAIEERASGRSKAVTLSGVKGILTTIGKVWIDLRLRSRRGPHATLGMLGPAGARPHETGLDGFSTNGTADAAHHAPLLPPAEKPLTVVVAGGSSGIGAELTTSLAKAGHAVYVCARRQDRLDAVTDNNTVAQGYVCDVADESQVQAFARWLAGRTSTVDVLLNCAGTFGPIGPLDQTDSAEWLDTIKTNLFGTYLVTKHLMPLLAGSDDPRILNFSGGGAFSPFPNYSAYACSKAAVVRLTECLAAELAPRGITVNAVAPGFVPTEAHHKTLAVGAEKAGALHYQRTKAVLAEGGASLATVVQCVGLLLSARMRGLTGKTISANFDPWRTQAFAERLADITRSDLWTMRRVNIVNLPEGSLRTALSEAWANFGARR
ncbi:MAG: SDR family NAD(P)-dependent oxidoreductase [Chloroflexi bacterium]|nr:SDR family NAD(P)-dependent oxidoreductase [Chloroflexota bacterium]